MKGARRVQVDSDCEGPLCLNDNAFELCARYVPDGERFFTQVSRYDDYLADVVRREGYEAGSTLKLVAPFLKAFGLTNEAMLAFSRGSVDMVAGAGEMFDHVRSLRLPVFVVSTSYQQFAHAVAERLRLPLDDVYCTPFDLDAVSLPDSEADELRALARRIAEAPPIELPEDGGEEVSPPARESIALMEEIFWWRLPAMNAQTIIDSVRLLGAEGKAIAIQSSLERTGYGPADVIYIGDSITDVKAFELVRDGGGLTVSFNGNRYAVDAAEIACAAADAVVSSILIDVFARHGRQAALDLASRWPQDRPGQIALLDGLGVSPAVVRRLESLSPRSIHIERVTAQSRAAVRARSAEVRVLLRGEHIGKLG
jgi:energy-converting hydrogenase A subunit R